MKQKHLFTIVLVITLILHLAFLVSAQEDDDDDDIELLGLELEELLSFINGILALVLFTLTFIAYRRNTRPRLLYVSIAFLLYSIRNFLVSSELFGIEIAIIDPLATTLDFIILLTFFFGVLKR